MTLGSLRRFGFKTPRVMGRTWEGSPTSCLDSLLPQCQPRLVQTSEGCVAVAGAQCVPVILPPSPSPSPLSSLSPAFFACRASCCTCGKSPAFDSWAWTLIRGRINGCTFITVCPSPPNPLTYSLNDLSLHRISRKAAALRVNYCCPTSPSSTPFLSTAPICCVSLEAIGHSSKRGCFSRVGS